MADREPLTTPGAALIEHVAAQLWSNAYDLDSKATWPEDCDPETADEFRSEARTLIGMIADELLAPPEDAEVEAARDVARSKPLFAKEVISAFLANRRSHA